jgi:hypothetical protein
MFGWAIVDLAWQETQGRLQWVTFAAWHQPPFWHRCWSDGWLELSRRSFTTRDVDITYDVTLPSQPRVRERVRWLAAEQLERVDGPHKSTTIF